MNYEEYAGKSLLLLGKTRSLNGGEFETLLKLHDMSVVKSFDESVVLIIEGKLMNPLEREESARLYELHAAPIVDITAIEQWLCGSIEPNRLLMSLKLSRDHARLVDFIQNPHITDELFFKLLKLYDWQGEGLFDTDTNRDVTAAIIGRFYEDLERNHNVQYAMSGLAHLIEKYGTTQLINVIASLGPIAREMKESRDPSLCGVLDAMALHPDTPEILLHVLLKERARLVAYREPLALEAELLALDDEAVNTVLAQNRSLSRGGADILEKKYPELIAQFYPLDEVRFQRLCNGYSPSLALNTSLTPSMQGKLMGMKDENVLSGLANNTELLSEHLETLFALNCYRVQLASNTSLSKQQLEMLYQNANLETLKALAANPSTPVEILYQLSLDQRTERAVKTNSAFGKHIQTTNLGWS